MSRRFQFSLRGLLIATVVVALAAAMFHYGKMSEVISVTKKLEGLKSQQASESHDHEESVWVGNVEYHRLIDAKVAATERRLRDLKGELSASYPRLNIGTLFLAVVCFLAGMVTHRCFYSRKSR